MIQYKLYNGVYQTASLIISEPRPRKLTRVHCMQAICIEDQIWPRKLQSFEVGREIRLV